MPEEQALRDSLASGADRSDEPELGEIGPPGRAAAKGWSQTGQLVSDTRVASDRYVCRS
jgi:hypothetical protein